MNSKEALKYLLADSELLYCEHEEDIKFYLEAEKEYNIVLKDLDRLEMLEEILDILRHNTNICKNGKGFTISIWLNTENCDMPSCSSMEELLKVLKVLKEKNVLKDTYSKEELGNDR